MLSVYMTPGGNLQLSPSTPLAQQPMEPDGDRSLECTQIYEPKQEGEWWSNARMECQLKHLAIPPFKARWPEHEAVFFFDNATNHTAFAADALRVSSMNISPGGNQNHNMRDGWNPVPNNHSRHTPTSENRRSQKGCRWYCRSMGYGGKVCGCVGGMHWHMLIFIARVLLGLGLQCQITIQIHTKRPSVFLIRIGCWEANAVQLHYYRHKKTSRVLAPACRKLSKTPVIPPPSIQSSIVNLTG